MTALAGRRRRSTWIAFAAALATLAVVAVLAAVGLDTLANSTAGRAADGPTELAPLQRLPFTATALVGTVDGDGRLTSVAAMALEPDGTGGSLVTFAATADSASGTLGELHPLAAAFAVEGPDAFRSAVEGLTGLSFDVIEVVDEQRFTGLIGPLGDLPVMFPIPFADASTGERWEQGESVLAAPAVARAVTATDPAIADWYLESARSAVWAAIADRVGAGIGSAEPVGSDDELVPPATLDEYLDRLFAGPVQFRALSFSPIDADRVAAELPAELAEAMGPAEIGVVAHDRAEIVMIVGAMAPARVGAPFAAPSFRLVAGFTPDDLADVALPDGRDESGDHAVNNADALKVAIDRLLFAQVNVVSVADDPEVEVPDVTRIEVADPAVIPAVEEAYGHLFGPVEVSAAEVAIEGIEVEVVLGRSFLPEVEAGLAGRGVPGGDPVTDVAGSPGDDDTSDDDTSDDDTSDD